MNICMIGAGYVGLVSAACFSDFGWNVTCVEKDAGKVEQLERGEIPIYEPGLDDLVEKNVRAGRLHFTTELAAVARDGRSHLSRGRHADAPRRRLCRPLLCLSGG